MKLSNLAADHIREVYEGNNWTDISFADTVKDISFKEAVTITPVSRNTIASLLYHIKFYNDHVLQRLHGTAPEISDANGFDMAELKNETEWKKLVDDVHRSFIKLAAAAE